MVFKVTGTDSVDWEELKKLVFFNSNTITDLT